MHYHNKLRLWCHRDIWEWFATHRMAIWLGTYRKFHAQPYTKLRALQCRGLQVRSPVFASLYHPWSKKERKDRYLFTFCQHIGPFHEATNDCLHRRSDIRAISRVQVSGEGCEGWCIEQDVVFEISWVKPNGYLVNETRAGCGVFQPNESRLGINTLRLTCYADYWKLGVRESRKVIGIRAVNFFHHLFHDWRMQGSDKKLQKRQISNQMRFSVHYEPAFCLESSSKLSCKHRGGAHHHRQDRIQPDVKAEECCFQSCHLFKT